MRSRRIPRWRLLTWVILAFNLGMLLWLVVALDAAGESGERCGGELCRDAVDLGSSTAAWLVIFLWLAGCRTAGRGLVPHAPHRGAARTAPTVTAVRTTVAPPAPSPGPPVCAPVPG